MKNHNNSFRPVTALLTMALALGMSACNLPNKPVTQAAAVASKPISNGEVLQVLRTMNEGEIKQSELALQRATDPATRQTAQHIIKEHTAMNQRISSITQSTNIKLDESPLSRGLRLQANEIAEDLAKLSGQKFDCMYLQKQIEQHALSVKTARSQLLPAASNPQVKELVAASIPSLEEHERMAQKSRASLTQC